jgi:hypothetical protein
MSVSTGVEACLQKEQIDALFFTKEHVTFQVNLNIYKNILKCIARKHIEHVCKKTLKGNTEVFFSFNE